MGVTCGRREREADAGSGEERSSRVPVVATVEGTLVHGMSAAFAGLRRNVGLGRSVSSVRGSSRAGSRTGDNRCPLDAEEGNVSACAKRTHSSWRRPKSALPARGRRPSLGPEARARQSPLNSLGASRWRWCARFGIAVGQACASRRNRHRGRNERTDARLAARHRFSKERSA
jgi:hypothetical protein